MNAVVQGLRHYLLALQFFTRIPVTGRLADWVGYSPRMLSASAAHFPGVGWLVGGTVALASVGLFALLPATPWTPLVVAALGTALGVLLTGAFHEDGLADVADGLGGSAERARALEIMKDSRIGAFGALALVLALLVKVTLLALLGSLGAGWLAWGLLLAHVLSRAWPLWLIRRLSHVGDEGRSKSKPLADAIDAPALGVACLWALAALAAAAWQLPVPAWLLALGLSALACGLMMRWFARRLQGYTGDCLGATQQVCELACYLGLALGAGV